MAIRYPVVALFVVASLYFAGVATIAVPQPIKALYIDYQGINWNAPEETVLSAFNSGWNVIILAFYLSGGAADMAIAWQGVPADKKKSTVDAIHAKGGVVLVSFGGATDSPFGHDANQLGQKVAQWAKDNYLDGVDFDLENFDSGFKGGSLNEQQTVDWVANLTNSARNTLGAGAFISHAPQSPYFGPVNATNTWAGKTGGYTGVYKKATSINFFNVQFYNQGAGCYVDYSGLFEKSCNNFPSTSVSEIAKAGIPLEKIVVGKYIAQGDASNGWIPPATLHTYFGQAASNLGWKAGVMAWVYHDAASSSSWIHAVYP